jgi:hypothetical protein
MPPKSIDGYIIHRNNNNNKWIIKININDNKYELKRKILKTL